MKYYIFSLVFILNVFNVKSQRVIFGKVIDKQSRESLAFANIIFNDNPLLITTTDIDGKFNYNLNVVIYKLTITHVGYQKFELSIKNVENNLMINLITETNKLSIVEVHKGENPANRIIKKVIENKNLNNPEFLSTFQYTAYNKVVYDIIFNKTSKKDSIDFTKFLKGGHLLITESVSQKKFIKPDFSEEEIIAAKVSGFKNPKFATIETDMQPFSFYENNIKLLNLNYLNPISKGSLNKYSFRLEDQFIKNKDTVYIISFKPKKGKNFDGLKGLLYINTNKYAVQNVIASPFEEGSLTLKIQQQYQLVNNKYWFPEKLNYELKLGDDKKSKSFGFSANGKSYINNIELFKILNKKDISPITISISDNAGKRNKSFWDNYRYEKLDNNEKNTYKIMDSVGNKNNFDKLILIVEKGIQNKFPSKYFDFDLSKTFIINKYEGYRLGTGFFTNEKYSYKWVLGAFLGYGVKDQTLKFGGNLNYEISKKHEMIIGYTYINDLKETGTFGLDIDNTLLSYRKIIGYDFSNLVANKITLQFKTLKYLNCNIEFSQAKINSINNFSFINSTFTAEFRYAFKEKLTDAFGKNLSLGSKYPVVYLYFTKGFKDVFKSELNFEKIEFIVNQTFFNKNIGQTTLSINAGYITKKTPSQLLFTGEGNLDRDSNLNFFTKNKFQTMRPYEFISDNFVNLFLTQDFGCLLFKTLKFKPNVILYNNIGWGNLSKKNVVNNLFFKTKEKIFSEIGLHIDNIVKFKINNLGYLGLGVGTFYRYGYYSNQELNDNLKYQLTLKYITN